MRISRKTVGTLELTALLRHLCLITLCVVPFMLASVANAQEQNSAEEQDNAEEQDSKNTTHDSSEVLRQDDQGSSQLICVIDRPFQIQRFAISCPDATRVLAKIADCCIPGDRWRLTGAVVDLFTIIEQTIASGDVDDFGSTSLGLSDNGGPGALEAIYECSYSGGINVFPAESTIQFEPDQGDCQVTMLEVDERIWRAP
jgi:hypothetical protein